MAAFVSVPSHKREAQPTGYRLPFPTPYILLMEVNLVFSNHPETRKEVLHFYDYSSRGYMLPVLHARDSI